MEDLNEYHATMIDRVLRFTRMKRAASVKEVSLVFGDVKDDRLDEANYNTADVESILDHAREMVTSTLESELAFLSHTQALLVRQLMTQAEIKQLTLSVDEAELENQTLLNAMKAYDELQEKMPELAAQKLKKMSGNIPMIEQINNLQDENKLLKQQLADSQAQNAGLSSDLQGSAQSAAATEEEKAAAIAKLQADMEKLQGGAAEAAESHGSELSALQSKIVQLEAEKRDLNSELTKKVQQTTQYKNLQQMLKKKTKQNKEFRNELIKLCPEKFAGSDDEDEETEEE